MVLSKVWRSAKWTAETIKGAAVVLASPNVPVPVGKSHPRQLAVPQTIGEMVRGGWWRHMWEYLPVLRLFVYSCIVTATVSMTVFPHTPVSRIKDAETAESHRKHEMDKFYGSRQKVNDKIYYEKYDPLKHTRPDAFGLVYGGGH